MCVCVCVCVDIDVESVFFSFFSNKIIQNLTQATCASHVGGMNHLDMFRHTVNVVFWHTFEISASVPLPIFVLFVLRSCTKAACSPRP